MEVSSRAREASSSSVKSRSAKSSIEGFGFDKAASSRLEFVFEFESGFEFGAEVVEAEGGPLEGAVAACEVVAGASGSLSEEAEGAAGGQLRGASSRRNCRNSPNSTLPPESPLGQ